MGVVGGITTKVLSKVHEIIPYDRYKEPHTNPEKLDQAEVVFITVSTPMNPDGSIDYSAIKNSLDTLEKITYYKPKKPLVVIRSTAVSGTTDDLEKKYDFNFVFNPEFLTEKNALKDMMNTDRIIIGANREEDYKKLEEVYKPIFSDAKYIHVNRKTSEMIKYTANVMLTSQIGIANEIYQICKRLDIDYNVVKDVVLLDDRIGKNISVPGPDGDLGFGGKCFPKDLNALIHLARNNRYRPYLLEEVWRLNQRLRKNKDWLDIPGATSENKNFQN